MTAEADPRDAAIDVIVRTGGRPAALLHRAVASLAAQTAGAIRLILVRHGPADTEALRPLLGPALRAIEVVEAPGANRGRAMAAGLARVSAPRFALLDDDDYLLPDHFRRLLQAGEGAPRPVFAYGDILAVDEGAPPGTPPRLFREGPAAPPLGAITNRISVHAFLAERAALEGLPFADWTLSTAEDALLVAALLARSTPVHSPHATCVYVLGRGDASAYLSHPDRAADELAFARAMAPHRAAIEARFGQAEAMDEATYLAPFKAAARHAALFAALKRRPADAPPVAVRDDALATPVSEDAALASIPAALAFEAAAGRVAAVGEGVEIEADADFAYAARLPLDLPTAARPVVVAVRAAAAEGGFGLALADAGHALATEARVDPLPSPLEVQLAWDRPGGPTLVVRRLNALGAAGPHLRLESVALAFPAAALGHGGDRAAAQAALEALAQEPRQILSPALAVAPAGEGEPVAVGALVEVDLGAAPWAYAFSAPLPPRAGALRVDLGPAPAALFVLRVDAAWEAVGERLEVPPGARPSALWLEPLSEGQAARLVVQAGPAPAGRVTLQAVFLYPAD